jgi:hypothetical protein
MRCNGLTFKIQLPQTCGEYGTFEHFTKNFGAILNQIQTKRALGYQIFTKKGHPVGRPLYMAIYN